MIRPKKDVPAEEFTLRRDGDRDLRFKGWRLAQVDTYNPDAKDERGTRCGSSRWKEWAVYQTESGKVVCSKVGCSRMPGEFDKGEALVIDMADQQAKAELRATLASSGLAVTKHSAEPVPPIEDQVRSFFGQSAMAKHLFSKLEIADVEVI